MPLPAGCEKRVAGALYVYRGVQIIGQRATVGAKGDRRQTTTYTVVRVGGVELPYHLHARNLRAMCSKIDKLLASQVKK